MGRSLDDSIEQICDRDIGLLQETTLVSLGQQLKATAFGEAMARYYVKFGTMKDILSLPPRAKMSEMVPRLFHFLVCANCKSYRSWLAQRSSTTSVSEAVRSLFTRL